MNKIISNKSFRDFSLDEHLIQALEEQEITHCSSVQAQSLTPLLNGLDVIAEAPTGTGKTLAFLLPIIQKYKTSPAGTKALILAPTRELAMQIYEETVKLVANFPEFKYLAVYGGENMRQQIQALKQGPQLIIATPGRLIDHLKHGRLKLGELGFLVLDEADRMLDMGFIDDVRYILQQIPSTAQIGLFTATLSREVLDISWVYQHKPVEVTVSAISGDKPKISEYYLIANGAERVQAIQEIMQAEELSKALVFVNMKQSAEITTKKLQELGFSARALQGDMPQSMRNRVMQAFREDKCNILVGTDLAARGLDIEDVDVVFNYNLPEDTESYTHRIGRTGRAGRRGLAFSFVAPGEKNEFYKFCRKLRIEPKLYHWQRPQKAKASLDAEDEAAIVARIRAQSQYLKNTDEESRYDPLKDMYPQAPGRGKRKGYNRRNGRKPRQGNHTAQRSRSAQPGSKTGSPDHNKARGQGRRSNIANRTKTAQKNESAQRKERRGQAKKTRDF